MPLLIVALGVLVLLILMIKLKVNGFISLIFVALLVGVAEGMQPSNVLKSIENGVGGTLGSLVLILAFGAMLGKLIADNGAAQRIASTLINKFGKKNIQWAMVITGLIVGLTMFYEVGFVLLIPLVFTVAAATELSLLYVGVPMAAALSVCHCFLPPHPGPIAIATIYHANVSMTLIYGLIIGIPTVIVSGPIFSKCLKKFEREAPKGLFTPKIFKEEELPSFATSILTAIVPVILMALSAITEMTLPNTSVVRKIFTFLGDPAMAMFIAVIVGIFTLGICRGQNISKIMDMLAESITGIAMIILIIGGGGAFKQVLVDSGVSKYIQIVMSGSHMSPLILAWLVACILRLALGSATVAAVTTSGIVLPLIATTHVNPALLVLATGSGSVIFSHVNDPGFWMFKEYFNLSVQETLSSWSVLETIISIMGLIGVLILSIFV